ncbi:cytochrome c maturation protein CcmE [Vineibacter terrae]|uniref:cytochrome c maturation protein CcmE n=1 Tax=Vineibacter terrae TaxID=2586908 RepID=UPI002E35F0A1|nr:cytochrome c maturation protein CcmE [Vineibacter terrae]HEX2888732.1 cytochrome c maturation protein CcmE [Vineibacter terrae]
MTRKRKRLWLLLGSLGAFALAVGLVLVALNDSLVFFYSPTEIAAKPPPAEKSLRIGGLVAPGSVAKSADGLTTTFDVTDTSHTLKVSYRGQLPDLFREGQGIVALGTLRADGVFAAREVLAKHDENYMPPEVADALKKAGRWKEGEPVPGNPK